jgi:hypothetical protein
LILVELAARSGLVEQKSQTSLFHSGLNIENGPRSAFEPAQWVIQPLWVYVPCAMLLLLPLGMHLGLVLGHHFGMRNRLIDRMFPGRTTRL